MDCVGKISKAFHEYDVPPLLVVTVLFLIPRFLFFRNTLTPHHEGAWQQII